ncbi:MAG: TonB-dependent receptor [Bacteroidales bacterium]|nr:TonB-dependent receptor [Bacteroidales bacterium]
MRKIIPLLLPLCLCATAAAQQVPDSTDIFYHHLNLDAVVITGLTGETRLRETPAPVTLVPLTELRTRAATNIIDALAHEPGVAQITTGGGISKPVIRGLGYNRVVVVHDGIRQEGQQWGDEHGVEIDGAGVHSVEILKGPASLMYGSDALAGVLVFNPAPIPADGTLAGSFASGFQTNNGLLDYSLDLTGNRKGLVWDARFTDRYAHAYRNALDGVVPNSGFRERAASGMFGLNRAWGYTRLRLSRYHLTPGIVEGERDPQSGELEEGPGGYRPGLPFQQVLHTKAVLDNAFYLPAGKLHAVLGWQQNRREEYEESPDEYGLCFRLNTLNYDIKYLAEEVSGWKYSLGLGGMYQRSDNLGEEFLIPAYRLFDAGLFATVTRRMGPWIVSGGLRADLRLLHSLPQEEDGALRFQEFSRRFGGWTGSLGAVRPLGDGFHLRANLSRGFRAPNLAELGSNGEHEGTFRYETGNAGLEPEYSLQGDLGLDYENRHFSARLALFANRIRNYIFLARIAGDEMPVYGYQAGNARLHGLEAGLDWHPVHSLHLGGTFSWVAGRLDSGDWLPWMPAPRLILDGKYEFSHGGTLLNNSFIALSLDWNFRQEHIYTAGGTETPTPAYALLNLSAGMDLVIRGRQRASLCVILENLTDAVWQSHLSRLKYAPVNPVTGRQGISGMGRNLVVKLQIPFGQRK